MCLMDLSHINGYACSFPVKYIILADRTGALQHERKQKLVSGERKKSPEVWLSKDLRSLQVMLISTTLLSVPGRVGKLSCLAIHAVDMIGVLRRWSARPVSWRCGSFPLSCFTSSASTRFLRKAASRLPCAEASCCSSLPELIRDPPLPAMFGHAHSSISRDHNHKS